MNGDGLPVGAGVVDDPAPRSSGPLDLSDVVEQRDLYLETLEWIADPEPTLRMDVMTWAIEAHARARRTLGLEW